MSSKAFGFLSWVSKPYLHASGPLTGLIYPSFGKLHMSLCRKRGQTLDTDSRAGVELSTRALRQSHRRTTLSGGKEIRAGGYFAAQVTLAAVRVRFQHVRQSRGIEGQAAAEW